MQLLPLLLLLLLMVPSSWCVLSRSSLEISRCSGARTLLASPTISSRRSRRGARRRRVRWPRHHVISRVHVGGRGLRALAPLLLCAYLGLKGRTAHILRQAPWRVLLLLLLQLWRLLMLPLVMAHLLLLLLILLALVLRQLAQLVQLLLLLLLIALVLHVLQALQVLRLLLLLLLRRCCSAALCCRRSCAAWHPAGSALHLLAKPRRRPLRLGCRLLAPAAGAGMLHHVRLPPHAHASAHSCRASAGDSASALAASRVCTGSHCCCH